MDNMNIGACADKLYELRKRKLEQQKVLSAIEAEEKSIREYLINTLPKSEASGVAGKLARVTIVTKEIPQVKDWGAFYNYVKSSGQFELMQRHLSSVAIKEHWESGEEIPGVEHFNIVSVSLNKV